MQGDREDRIRHRAYAIWEREGRPEGRGDSHWAQACAEIEAEDRASAAEPAADVVKKAVRRTKKAAAELLGAGLNAAVDVVEEAVAPKKPRARKAKAEPAAPTAAKPARAKAVKAEAADPAASKPAATRTRRKAAASDTEPAH